ncbi:MAG: tetratricopeptide repeat protein [Planctomycetota bacterium]
MKILPWLAFFLSLALIAAVFRMASDSEIVGPERIYKETLEAYSRGRIGAEGAIDRLETAIALAEAEGKSNLVANLYTERGRFFLQMNGLNRAREDFLRVLEVYRPGDLDVERLLVDVEMKAGNYDQARERLQDILSDDQGDSPAWAMMGRLHLLSGREKMQEAEQAINRTLVAEDSETAIRLLRRITARDPRDPSRVALVRTLRALFNREDDEVVRRVLDIADLVSEDNRSARSSSASSLAQRINAPAAQQILGLFSSAERHEEAARLGLLLTERPVVRNNSVATLQILRSMKALGRTKTAVEVLAPWQRKGLTVDDPEFYELGCQLLYDAEEWTDLLLKDIISC